MRKVEIKGKELRKGRGIKEMFYLTTHSTEEE